LPLYKKNLEESYGVVFGSRYPTNWDDLLGWGIRNFKGQSFRVSLCKVSRWSVVYHICIQRNSRIHAGIIKIEEQMEKEIGRDVKARMIGTKEVCSSILN
jgi:hypothetical protein